MDKVEVRRPTITTSVFLARIGGLKSCLSTWKRFRQAQSTAFGAKSALADFHEMRQGTKHKDSLKFKIGSFFGCGSRSACILLAVQLLANSKIVKLFLRVKQKPQTY